MSRVRILRAWALVALCLALFGAGMLVAKNIFHQPGSIVHVVTIKWKADSTPEQQQAALDGVKTMAGEIPGIKNIWLKGTKVQPRDFTSAFVIEFEDKAAAERYVDHPAHVAWMKIYEPIREESRSHQITN